MTKYKLAFVVFDSAKEKHAVAIAEDGATAKSAIFVKSKIRPMLLRNSQQSCLGDTANCIFATRLGRRHMN